MRLSLPTAVERLRPERPQLVALVGLLAASFLLTLGLAWQAWDAGRGEEEAADAILARNVRSVAEEWAFWTHYAMKESFSVALAPAFEVLDEAPETLHEPAVRAALNTPPLPPGIRASGTDVVRLTFGRADHGADDAAFVRWMRHAIVEDRSLRVGGSVVAAFRADVPFGTGYLVYAGRLTADAVASHAVVYWLDPSSVAETLRTILHLGAAGGQGVLAVTDPPDQTFSLSAFRTADGEQLVDGGPFILERLAATAPSSGFVRGLTFRAGLKPAALELLLPGGYPASRLPALAALLSAIALLVSLTVLLLRREAELHRLQARFVSGVSHELRTPLAQIRMFAETLMLGRVRSEADRRRSLEIIDQEARRLGTLVENILTFSRAERGGVTVTPEVTRISAEIGAVVEDFLALPRARRADVRLELQEDVLVPVDRDALRQIVNNLLDNAVKYGPERQRITVGLALFDGSARLWVDDEGPGIPAVDRARVFQSFFRLRRDEDSRTAGSGIGLAVVRELAAMHSGRTWAEEAPGGGARLVVVFPEADLAVAGTAAAVA